MAGQSAWMVGVVYPLTLTSVWPDWSDLMVFFLLITMSCFMFGGYSHFRIIWGYFETYLLEIIVVILIVPILVTPRMKKEADIAAV